MKKTSIDDIIKVVDKFIKDNNNNVVTFGSFVVFNKDGEVEDDRYIGYGPKDTVKISLNEMMKNLKEDKEEFINW